MGKIVLSNSFVTVADASITARSTDASIGAKVNVMDRWHLKRRFRANDVTTNDYLLKFNFGAAQTLVAVTLQDVNFNKVKIQGHASDTWTSPSYAGSDLTVSQNAITGRYNIYIPLTAFNYQYLRVFIPTGTTAVGTYTTKWEAGTLCFLSAQTTLTKNTSFGYAQSGQHSYRDIQLPHGGSERVLTGSSIAWNGSLVFGNRYKTSATELYTLNAMDMAQPLVYYRNNSDTSEVYLCVRDGAIETTEFTYNMISGGSIKLKELV